MEQDPEFEQYTDGTASRCRTMTVKRLVVMPAGLSAATGTTLVAEGPAKGCHEDQRTWSTIALPAPAALTAEWSWAKLQAGSPLITWRRIPHFIPGGSAITLLSPVAWVSPCADHLLLSNQLCLISGWWMANTYQRGPKLTSKGKIKTSGSDLKINRNKQCPENDKWSIDSIIS